MSILQNTLKIYTMLTLHQELRSFAKFGEYLYDSNEKANLKTVQPLSAVQRSSCMRRSIKRTYSILIAMNTVAMLAALMYSIFPSYMWTIKKKKVWMLPVLVPFTDMDGQFYLNVTCQMIFSSSGTLSALLLDLFFALCISHHGTASSLIEQSISELNEILAGESSAKLSRTKLINILRQFQDLNE